MKEAGFSGASPDMITRTEMSGDSEAAAAAELHQWFGVSAEKWGAKYGYHELPQDAVMQYEQVSGEDLPPAYYDELFGTDEEVERRGGMSGGCFGHAEEVLNEGVPPAAELDAIQMELERRTQELVRVDAGVAAAAAEWSKCMAEDGYRYANPEEPFAEFAGFTLVDGNPVRAYTSMAAGAEEKRVAAADGACKEKVGFWDAVKEAEAAAEKAAGAEMRSDLDTVLAAHERKAQNAEAILSSK
ncbi:MAG: hypothetical protein LBO20_11145 [Bifidobacteriaceae bacterium]|jgi:hypothetical protein|nr:hypothetical protein [Bifidobacteriaceae bacterium]